MNPRPAIHLHIERIVLEDLPIETRDGPLFAAAIEAELTTLLADGDWAAFTGGAFARTAARPIVWSGPVPSAVAGTQVARAIHEAVAGTAFPTWTLPTNRDGRTDQRQFHTTNANSTRPAP